jgi:hypothetical protein
MQVSVAKIGRIVRICFSSTRLIYNIKGNRCEGIYLTSPNFSAHNICKITGKQSFAQVRRPNKMSVSDFPMECFRCSAVIIGSPVWRRLEAEIDRRERSGVGAGAG